MLRNRHNESYYPAHPEFTDMLTCVSYVKAWFSVLDAAFLGSCEEICVRGELIFVVLLEILFQTLTQLAMFVKWSYYQTT